MRAGRFFGTSVGISWHRLLRRILFIVPFFMAPGEFLLFMLSSYLTFLPFHLYVPNFPSQPEITVYVI